MAGHSAHIQLHHTRVKGFLVSSTGLWFLLIQWVRLQVLAEGKRKERDVQITLSQHRGILAAVASCCLSLQVSASLPLSCSLRTCYLGKDLRFSWKTHTAARTGGFDVFKSCTGGRSSLRGLEEKKPRGGKSSKAGAQARVPGLKGATMGALA